MPRSVTKRPPKISIPGQMGKRHPLPGCRFPIWGAYTIIAIATAAALLGLGVRRG